MFAKSKIDKNVAECIEKGMQNTNILKLNKYVLLHIHNHNYYIFAFIYFCFKTHAIRLYLLV